MSKSIWKYQLKLLDMQGVDMPTGAEILSVQVQNDEPMLWALVDPGKEKENRVIVMCGTGHTVEMPHNKKFIDTIQLMGGSLVFHFF